jgi:hypothetical protein
MTRIQSPRRTVLGTIAGTLTALAGCIGGENPISSQSQSKAIREVSTGGTSLEIILRSSANVDAISVIAPSGSEFKTKQVATGATRVTVEIGSEYEVGTYRVVATRSGNEVGNTSVEIQPEVKIREIIVGEKSEQDPPKNLPYAEEQALIILENTGSGADSAENLSITGGVPNPTEPEKKRKSGIYDSSDEYGAVDRVTVPAGSQVRLWSTTKPFLFTGDGVECEKDEQEHSATVELDFGNSGKISQQIDVKYSGSEGSEDCAVTISQG